MYITMQTIKRNLGLFNLQLMDIIIGGIVGIIFTILFLLKAYTVGFVILSLGALALVPMNFSKCDRLYKLVILFSGYMFNTKEYVYFSSDDIDV